MPPAVINDFRGDYFFLSNFYPCRIVLADGSEWRSSEAVFQAAKTRDPAWREAIRTAESAKQAKALGRAAPIRKDWSAVRVHVMRNVIAIKFADEDLGARLVATGGAYLEEGNTWGDTFWGVCGGTGSNVLGLILMERRALIPAF